MVAKTCSARMPSATAKGTHVGTTMQRVKDIPQFVQKWAGRYKAHISQKLWHSDEPVPPGYQLATLSQAVYAVGSIALARKLRQESKSARVPSKKPTLPIRTR